MLQIVGVCPNYVPRFSTMSFSIRAPITPLTRVIQLEMQGCESSAHVIKIRVMARPRVRKPSIFTSPSPQSLDKPVIINLISDKGGATAPILYADTTSMCP